MLHRTEGIVLRSFPLGDADLIVTFLTKDYGIIKCFAKSPRKTKSKFGSSLEPLTYSKISFWGKEDAPLPRLTQSDILKSHEGLREGLDCFLMLNGLVELLINFMLEREANLKVFRLFSHIIDMIEKDCRRLYALAFRARFLALKGYAPGLQGCARCGGPGRVFYISQGAVVCSRCASKLNIRRLVSGNDDAIIFSTGSRKLYDALEKWELRRLPRLKAGDKMLSELEGLIDAHVEYRLSKRLRVKGFERQ